MSPWIPVVGIAIGAIATVLAARANARANARAAELSSAPATRNVAVSELQAGLAEQRIMLDRAHERADHDAKRIDGLEAEVAECEIGRRRDRERFDSEMEALRADMRAMRAEQ